ncbi:hypothetical protein IEQ34_007189 [Dendrobium chrysotoxum]|uniref:Uncharacterized protein n=1 Tax=Dendrobium chrysotoxum TaxID=161865 RepID=A0AAV7HA75_DENCH|nr:hypothetical protein IEQ34_007189 [Dendrobium chrysotoxum]
MVSEFRINIFIGGHGCKLGMCIMINVFCVVLIAKESLPFRRTFVLYCRAMGKFLRLLNYLKRRSFIKYINKTNTSKKNNT